MKGSEGILLFTAGHLLLSSENKPRNEREGGATNGPFNPYGGHVVQGWTVLDHLPLPPLPNERAGNDYGDNQPQDE